MNISDLIFTGFNRRVAALYRDTGEILWQWKAPYGSQYVSLLLDKDRLIVSVEGYTYALDPFTGCEIWMNKMPGFGTGVASLVSVHGSSSTYNLATAANDEEARSRSSNN
jgi:outer membrane protein assembly factor BamB